LRQQLRDYTCRRSNSKSLGAPRGGNKIRVSWSRLYHSAFIGKPLRRGASQGFRNNDNGFHSMNVAILHKKTVFIQKIFAR
jgi:hypothetical protein